MIIEGNKIIASENKVFRRKNTEEIFGKEVNLGYSYYISGVRQNPPHLDLPSDFEEIDEAYGDNTELSDTEALNIITGLNDEEE